MLARTPTVLRAWLEVLRSTLPALGAVTLRQRLATWVVHDLNHFAQIARATAFQSRDEVGPWREYLPILPH